MRRFNQLWHLVKLSLIITVKFYISSVRIRIKDEMTQFLPHACSTIKGMDILQKNNSERRDGYPVQSPLTIKHNYLFPF